MPISFPCESCGARFTVPDEAAGRKGRCKKCGAWCAVPDRPADDDPYSIEATGLYEVAEAPEPTPSRAPAPSTFVSTRGVESSTTSKPRRRRSVSEKPPRDWSPANVRRMLTVPLVAVLVLGFASRFVPGGTLYAGWGLLALGASAVFIGYWVGAYVAYTEDLLYALLYLLIPFYAGYYIVTRWDEMWPWFATSAAGVVALTLARWILQSGIVG